MTRLAGQSAVVVGAAKGVGFAIAAALASANADVTLADRNQDAVRAAAERLREAGANVTAKHLDLSVPDEHERLVREVIADTGRLDAWVNGNVQEQHGVSAEWVAADDWRRALDDGLSAVFYGSQAAGRQMLTQRHGVILNVVALEGEHPIEGSVLSSVGAGAGTSLTRALAADWAAAGVRVVGIAPGHLPVTAAVPDEQAEAVYAKRTPLRRLALPMEIGQAAVFLLSDEASYITGEILPVDGGWRAYQLF